MRPPLKLIEWEDAYNGNHDWIQVRTIPERVKPLIVSTVGFEIRRDEERVTLAMTYGDSRDEPTCCDLFTIPIALIRTERVLQEGAPQSTARCPSCGNEYDAPYGACQCGPRGPRHPCSGGFADQAK